MTARACDVLRDVDVIFAEDTRRSARLLQHFGLRTRLQSLHEHNEQERLGQVVQLLQSGGTVALISDAGTPLVSDPGFRLVRECQALGLRVTPVPGASALIAALCVSGLPTDSFIFCGFPPARALARRTWLAKHRSEHRTQVFFESRHRIVASLLDMQECFGALRTATLARELTKTYETIKQASLADLYLWISTSPEQQKGEFVIVVAGAQESAEEIEETELRRVISILLRDFPASQAASTAAQLLGCKRKRAYALAIEMRTDS